MLLCDVIPKAALPSATTNAPQRAKRRGGPGSCVGCKLPTQLYLQDLGACWAVLCRPSLCLAQPPWHLPHVAGNCIGWTEAIHAGFHFICPSRSFMVVKSILPRSMQPDQRKKSSNQVIGAALTSCQLLLAVPKQSIAFTSSSETASSILSSKLFKNPL